MKVVYVGFLLIVFYSCKNEKSELILKIDSEVLTENLSDHLEIADTVILYNEGNFISSIDKIIFHDYIYVLNRYEQPKILIFDKNGIFNVALKLPFQNTEPIYDFLINESDNKLEILASSGVYDFDLNDHKFIAKRNLNISATRFLKSDKYYYFVCSEENYLTITNSNLRYLYGYLPEFPAHGKHPFNSFVRIDKDYYVFTNYNNALYRLNGVNVESELNFSFDGDIIKTDKIWTIHDFSSEGHPYFNEAILERFLFSVKDYLYFTYTKSNRKVACLHDKFDNESWCYDIFEIMGKSGQFPYIIGTKDDKYFVSLVLDESENLKLNILEPK